MRRLLSIAMVSAACGADPPPPSAPAQVQIPEDGSRLPAGPEPREEAPASDHLRQLVVARPFVKMSDCGHDDTIGDLTCGYSVAGEPRPAPVERRLRIFLTDPPGLVLAAVDWEPERALGDAPALMATCAFEARGELRGVHFGAAPRITGYRHFGELPVGVATECAFEPYSLPAKLRAAHLVVAHGDANRAPRGVTRSREEAAARVAEAAAKLADGSLSFVDAVSTYSDEPGAAARGGDLGTFRPEVMAPEFTLVLLGTPVGAQSPAFETSFGFHVLERR